jgi:hypothetical protein
MMNKKVILIVGLRLEHVGKIFPMTGVAQYVAHRKVFLSWKPDFLTVVGAALATTVVVIKATATICEQG